MFFDYFKSSVSMASSGGSQTSWIFGYWMNYGFSPVRTL